MAITKVLFISSPKNEARLE